MFSTIDKRSLLAGALEHTGINGLLRRTRQWNGVVAVAYHRVGSPAGSQFDHELYSATAESFDEQVAFLTRHFDVIGPEDVEGVLTRRKGRFALITFDDGYRDNYDLAFPILKSHSATATFFVSTGFVDQPRMAWWDEIAWMVRKSSVDGLAANPWTGQPIAFDRPGCPEAIRRLLTVYKRLDGNDAGGYLEFLGQATGADRCPASLAESVWMTWDMVREMRSAGMTIGGHTVSHPVLSRLGVDEQSREIGGCKSRLEEQLGQAVSCFSYPVGGPDAFDESTRACLQLHGIRLAFSYYGGYLRSGEPFDRYDLPRIAVELDVSRSLFRSIAALPGVLW